MSAQTNVEAFLNRVRDWWRSSSELGGLDAHEFDRVAHDLGMRPDDLRDLTARGPDAAHLLYDRMRALGITAEDVERVAPGLMRNLERTCSFCSDKGECAHDLASRPRDARWQHYCPNAPDLAQLAELKGKSPT